MRHEHAAQTQKIAFAVRLKSPPRSACAERFPSFFLAPPELSPRAAPTDSQRPSPASRCNQTQSRADRVAPRETVARPRTPRSARRRSRARMRRSRAATRSSAPRWPQRTLTPRPHPVSQRRVRPVGARTHDCDQTTRRRTCERRRRQVERRSVDARRRVARIRRHALFYDREQCAPLAQALPVESNRAQLIRRLISATSGAARRATRESHRNSPLADQSPQRRQAVAQHRRRQLVDAAVVARQRRRFREKPKEALAQHGALARDRRNRGPRASGARPRRQGSGVGHWASVNASAPKQKKTFDSRVFH